MIQSKLNKTLVSIIFPWFNSFINHIELISDQSGTSLKTKHEITTNWHLFKALPLCQTLHSGVSVGYLSQSTFYRWGNLRLREVKPRAQGHSSKAREMMRFVQAARCQSLSSQPCLCTSPSPLPLRWHTGSSSGHTLEENMTIPDSCQNLSPTPGCRATW